MPEILKVGERKSQYFRIGLEGEPKSGKTRFGTSIPDDETWGHEFIYVCTDPGSENIEASSILPKNRERVIAVRPSTSVRKNKDGSEQIIYDPHTEAFAIATRNWRAEFPNARTLIWDTMSTTAREILYAYADSGVFVGEKGDKHITVGTIGKADFVANPMPGDYGMAQGATFRLIRALFNQPMNIICLFHIRAVETDTGQVLAFGPAGAGQADVRTIAGMFDNLLRTDVVERVTNDKPPKKETKYIVHTQRKGLYLGGIRTGHDKNPIPELSVDDPTAAWLTLTNVLKGEK